MCTHERGPCRGPGARARNLTSIDVTISPVRLVALVGVSGSRKSSLAFDGLYADGQRRYVELLSAYAWQFAGQMGTPSCQGTPDQVADASASRTGRYLGDILSRGSAGRGDVGQPPHCRRAGCGAGPAASGGREAAVGFAVGNTQR